MAKLKLPFELEKPSSNEYVTQSSQIGHNGEPLNQVLGDLSKLDNISKQSTQSEEKALVFETDGGVPVGQIDANGADFTNLKRGGQQVARMSDLPTKDTSIGDNPSNSHIPTTKAVKEYVDANSGGDYPIETETTASEVEEQVWGNDAGTQEYAKIGSYGMKAKTYLDMQGNPIIEGEIGNSPSTTHAPSSKAVKDYVDEHGGGTGGFPISNEAIHSASESIIVGMSEQDPTVIINKNELRVKRLLTLAGEPIIGTVIPNTIIVDCNGGGDYTTIEDALANAGDTASKHVTILVMPGTYYPAPRKNWVDPYVTYHRNLSLIGINRDACILRGNCGYYSQEGIDYALLRINGNVLIKNFTMINTCENYQTVAEEEGWDLSSPHCRAYCWHADGERRAGDVSAIENCKLYNDHFSAIGWGLRANSTLRIKNVEIEADVNAERNALSGFSGYGAIYGHLATGRTNASGQRLEVIDCLIRNNYYPVALNQMDGSGASGAEYANLESTLLIFRNTFISTDQSQAFKIFTVPSSYPDVCKLDICSSGNNVANANYKNEAGTTAKRPVLTSGDEGFEYYDSTLKKKILWNGTAWKNIDGSNLS